MATDDIVGYTYDTETLCPSCCIEAVVLDKSPFHDDKAEDILNAVAEQVYPHIDRMDERTFDSSTFPKIIFEVQVESSEERCDHCGESLVG